MLKTAIQQKIIDAIEAGSFYAITYDGKDPTEGVVKKTPASIVVNEISGMASRTVRSGGARTGGQAMTDWLFEARIKFDMEVSTDTFLTTELSTIYFTYDNQIRVVAAPSFLVGEPPRQGSHNGTELVINFLINTRR